MKEYLALNFISGMFPCQYLYNNLFTSYLFIFIDLCRENIYRNGDK